MTDDPRPRLRFTIKVFAKTATPQTAFALARALELGVTALPASAQSRRRRIAAVWTDLDHRFPVHPYIANQVREAEARLAGR